MATKNKVTVTANTGESIENTKIDGLPETTYTASDELQQILEHFGENSSEYAEAKAKAEAE